MTTTEKIISKVKKHNKSVKRTKLIGFIGMSIILGFIMLFTQGASYESISKLPNDYVYTPDTTKSIYNQKLNQISTNFSFWIYDKYSYIDNISPTLTIITMIGSS